MGETCVRVFPLHFAIPSATVSHLTALPQRKRLKGSYSSRQALMSQIRAARQRQPLPEQRPGPRLSLNPHEDSAPSIACLQSHAGSAQGTPFSAKATAVSGDRGPCLRETAMGPRRPFLCLLSAPGRPRTGEPCAVPPAAPSSFPRGRNHMPGSGSGPQGVTPQGPGAETLARWRLAEGGQRGNPDPPRMEVPASQPQWKD